MIIGKISIKYMGEITYYTFYVEWLTVNGKLLSVELRKQISSKLIILHEPLVYVHFYSLSKAIILISI